MVFNVTLALLLPLSDPRQKNQTDCDEADQNLRRWDASAQKCLRLRWTAAAAMALQAAQDFNSRRDGGYFQDCTNRTEGSACAWPNETLGNCNQKISLRIHDLQNVSEARLVRTVIREVERTDKPDAMIVSYSSERLQAVAPILRAKNILQLSPTAASTRLTDVLRTVPTHESLDNAICRLWKREMGIEEAFVLRVDDFFGLDFNQGMQHSCQREGVSIHSFKFESNNQASVREAVHRLASSRMRTGIVATSHASDDGLVARALYEEGVVGGSESSMVTFTSRNTEYGGLNDTERPSIMAAINGSTLLLNVGGRLENELWKNFSESGFHELPFADLSNHIEKTMTSPPRQYAGVDANAFGQDRAWVQEPRVRDTGAFLYDLVAAVGLLACKEAPNETLEKGTDLWKAKDEVSFRGLTGKVEFTEDGDRAPGTANVALYNLLNPPDPDTTLRLLGDFQNGSQDAKWEWRGGSREASGMIFTGGFTTPPDPIVRLTIMTEMSDSTITTQATCESMRGHRWATDTRKCYTNSLENDEFTAPMALGLAAVQHFNERDDRFVPAFGSLSPHGPRPCDKRIVVATLDTGTTSLAAVRAVGGLVSLERRPDTVVGPASSRVSELIVPTLGKADIPAISFSATSSSLDDERSFPLFLRTIPTDGVVAHAICQLWANELGFVRVFVLSVNDPYGTSFSSALQASCRAEGIEVSPYSFDLATEDKIQTTVRRLADEQKRAGTHVGLIISTRTRDTKVIARELYENGMVGDDVRSWIGFNEFTHVRLVELPERMRRAFSGSLQVRQAGATAENQEWAKFEAKGWTSLKAAQMNEHLPKEWPLAANFFDRSLTGGLESAVRHYGAFQYDAVAAVGLLACEVAPTGPLPSDFGRKLWDARQSRPFDGLSGHVEFASNGNRNESTANIELNNVMFEGTKVQTVLRAVYSGDVWNWEGGTRAESGLVFDGERRKPPKQSRERHDDSYKSLVYQLAIPLAIGIPFIFCVAALPFCYFGRRRRRELRQQEAVIRVRGSDTPATFNKPDGTKYHLFLSHKWPTGQEPCARIREKLLYHAPAIKCFLDVHDLEDIDVLEWHVKCSMCVLVFLSRGYFNSKNCLRELQTAIDEKKPLVLVHDADQEAGGSTLETLKKDCPDDLRDKVFESGHPVITWLRTPDFQDGVLLSIAEFICRSGEGSSRGGTGAMPERRASLTCCSPPKPSSATKVALYIPRSLASMSYRLSTPITVYVSPNNRGATELMEELNEYLGKTHHLQVTNMKPELIVNGVRELQLQRLASTQSARSREVSVEQLLPGRFSASGDNLVVTPAAKAKLLARLVNLCQSAASHIAQLARDCCNCRPRKTLGERLITQLSKMKRASGHAQLTSQILSLGECMLLYLEPEVFSNLGELEEELHEALQTNYPIVLVHPEMLIKFNELIEQCPESLLKGRLLSTKALAWRTDGNHKQVCLAQVAKLLGGHGSDPDRLSNAMSLRKDFVSLKHVRTCCSSVLRSAASTNASNRSSGNTSNRSSGNTLGRSSVRKWLRHSNEGIAQPDKISEADRESGAEMTDVATDGSTTPDDGGTSELKAKARMPRKVGWTDEA